MLFGVFWFIFRANSKKITLNFYIHWITIPLNVNIKRPIAELSVILGLLSFCVFFSVNSLLMKIFVPKCLSPPSNWTYSKLKSSFMFISLHLSSPPALPLLCLLEYRYPHSTSAQLPYQMYLCFPHHPIWRI